MTGVLTVDGDLAVSGALLVDTMRTSEANLISIEDDVTISGALVVGTALANKNLTVNGNLEVLGNFNIANPFWVAGKVNGLTSPPTILSSKGRYTFTVTRATQIPSGVYKVSWTVAHPNGGDAVVLINSQNSNAYVSTVIVEDPNSPQTAYYVWVTLRNSAATVLADERFHIAVLA